MNQAIFLTFAYGCFIFSIALGIWLYRRLIAWELLDRLVASTITVTVLIWFQLMLRQWLSQPLWPLNASRLAPTFSLVHGYQLYYGPDSGPVLSTIYGPITALIYLPSTLAKSPTSAILVASLIALICFFLPVLWLFLTQTRSTPQTLLLGLYTFIGFGFFTLSSDSLTYSAFRIHADAPALGLSLAACAVIYDQKNRYSLPALFLSATFAVLAVWSKQVTLPILFALPIYLLLAEGFKVFKKYIFCLFISGIVISTILLVVFNPELVWFNLIKVPSGNPWTSDHKIVALLGTMRISLQKSLPPLIVIIFYILYQVLFSSERHFKTRLQHNSWSMVALLGLFMIPASLLGYVKVGGDVNSFSFSLYFFAVAAGLIFLHSTTDLLTLNNAIKLLIIVIIIAVVFTEIPPAFPTLYQAAIKTGTNKSEQAYDYAKKHPGSAYFPFYPLSTLMAEGQVEHLYYGVIDRELSGFSLTPKHFHEVLPVNLQLVALSFTDAEKDKYIAQHLPEFSHKTQNPELPGWIVYTKK